MEPIHDFCTAKSELSPLRLYQWNIVIYCNLNGLETCGMSAWGTEWDVWLGNINLPDYFMTKMSFTSLP